MPTASNATVRALTSIALLFALVPVEGAFAQDQYSSTRTETGRLLGTALIDAAADAGLKPGAAYASRDEVLVLARRAASQLEVLAQAMNDNPDSDASRSAYAAVLLTLEEILNLSHQVDFDLTASQVESIRTQLSVLTPDSVAGR